jgi:hypothetical protein
MALRNYVGDLQLLIDGESHKHIEQYILNNGDELIIADFRDKQFMHSESVKILLTFDNKFSVYCCTFENDCEGMTIYGKESILFSGFGWSERDGKVKELRVSDHLCFERSPEISVRSPHFTVSLYNAIEKKQMVQKCHVQTDGVRIVGDEPDGCSSNRSNVVLFETGEKSNEIYSKNTRYKKGSLIKTINIIFYN